MSQRCWFLLEYFHYRVRRGRSAERFRSRDHLVDHDARAPDVATRIDSFCARLFGRHVADGAHNQTGRGLEFGYCFFIGAEITCRDSPLLSELSQSKIEDLNDMVAPPNHDVLRFHVEIGRASCRERVYI